MLHVRSDIKHSIFIWTFTYLDIYKGEMMSEQKLLDLANDTVRICIKDIEDAAKAFSDINSVRWKFSMDVVVNLLCNTAINAVEPQSLDALKDVIFNAIHEAFEEHKKEVGHE
jgi:hypothetical protein